MNNMVFTEKTIEDIDVKIAILQLVEKYPYLTPSRIALTININVEKVKQILNQLYTEKRLMRHQGSNGRTYWSTAEDYYNLRL